MSHWEIRKRKQKRRAATKWKQTNNKVAGGWRLEWAVWNWSKGEAPRWEVGDGSDGRGDRRVGQDRSPDNSAGAKEERGEEGGVHVETRVEEGEGEALLRQKPGWRRTTVGAEGERGEAVGDDIGVRGSDGRGGRRIGQGLPGVGVGTRAAAKEERGEKAGVSVETRAMEGEVEGVGQGRGRDESGSRRREQNIKTCKNKMKTSSSEFSLANERKTDIPRRKNSRSSPFFHRKEADTENDTAATTKSSGLKHKFFERKCEPLHYKAYHDKCLQLLQDRHVQFTLGRKKAHTLSPWSALSRSPWSKSTIEREVTPSFPSF
jgi:hypothetical protein